jgi:hypothetical protein
MFIRVFSPPISILFSIGKVILKAVPSPSAVLTALESYR